MMFKRIVCSVHSYMEMNICKHEMQLSTIESSSPEHLSHSYDFIAVSMDLQHTDATYYNLVLWLLYSFKRFCFSQFRNFFPYSTVFVFFTPTTTFHRLRARAKHTLHIYIAFAGRKLAVWVRLHVNGNVLLSCVCLMDCCCERTTTFRTFAHFSHCLPSFCTCLLLCYCVLSHFPLFLFPHRTERWKTKSCTVSIKVVIRVSNLEYGWIHIECYVAIACSSSSSLSFPHILQCGYR